tara:strand:- start:2007 stop:2786 length:780 start_codon:yes stop_codon:yes gene_type:complete
MSFTGKSISAIFKDLLHMDNSNTGISSTAKVIKDGDGNSSALSISDDTVKVKPINDDTTEVFTVTNKSGTSVFSVDSSNSIVRGGVSGFNYMNTQFTTFAIRDFSPVAGAHYPMSWIPYFHDASSSAINPQAIGTGGTPDTSLTISSNAHDWIHCIWIPSANINVESIKVLLAADASVSVKFFVRSYDINNSGATAGDLTNGAEVYSSATHAVAANSVLQSSQSIDVDVANGKAIIVSVENESSTDDISCVATLRWHLT